MGHCSAANLVHHFYEIVQPLGTKGVHLFHLGMDGPQVNTKFEKDLQALLYQKEDINLAYRNMLTTSCSHCIQIWYFRSGLSI